MKKKLTIVLMISILLISALSMVFYAVSVQEWEAIENGFAGGNGTEDDPYIIKTPEQLYNFAKLVSTYHTDWDWDAENETMPYFALGADIYLNDETFTFDEDSGLIEVTDGTNTAYLGTGILGNSVNYKASTVFDTVPSEPGVWYTSKTENIKGSYAGELNQWTPIRNEKGPLHISSLDGREFSVHGMFIHSDQNYVGLFGNVACTIERLNITNSYVYTTGDYAGAIAGNSGGTIRRCTNEATVIGHDYVGGIAGMSTTVNTCKNKSLTCGNDNVGGITGYGNTSYCTHYGYVTGHDNVGGIVGFQIGLALTNGMTIAHNNHPSVIGNNYVGGIAGKSNSHIQDCVNAIEVQGNEYVGGIVGGMTSESLKVTTCYNNAKVIGNSLSAGIIGNTAIIENSYCRQGCADNCQSPVSFDSLNDTKKKQLLVGFDFEKVWGFHDYSIPTLNSAVALRFYDGKGTLDDPYIITKASHLSALSLWGDYGQLHVEIANDIAFNDETFTFNPDTGLVKVTDGVHTAYYGTGIPGDNSGNNTVFDSTPSDMGTWYATETATQTGKYEGELLNHWHDGGFSGTLNGNGHTISGIYLTSTFYDYSTSGLIRHLSDAVVTDLHIKNSLIYSVEGGALAKHASNCTIRDCSVDAIVLGTVRAGALVGDAGVGTVFENCRAYGTVFGVDFAGGIAGSLTGSVSQCQSSASVYSLDSAGGIVGELCGIVRNSFNQGTVRSDRAAGGIVGCMAQGSLLSNYNVGKTQADTVCGGIVGRVRTANYYDIEHCYYLSGTAQTGIGCTYTFDEKVHFIPQIMPVPDDPHATASLTQEEATKQESYLGFDFHSVWEFSKNSDYRYPCFISTASDGAIWDGNKENIQLGNGTEADPYIISTPGQLACLNTLIQSTHPVYYALANDIVFNDTTKASWHLSASPWTPLGTEKTPFKHYLDGRGHTIYGLYIDAPDAALVAYNQGTIQNLTIADSYINGTGTAAGIACYNNGSIIRCTNRCPVTGNLYTAGIAAVNNGTIENCQNKVAILGSRCAGGITALHTGTLIAGCQNSAVVRANTNVGGIVGRGENEIVNCRNTGSVYGSEYVGGIVGYQNAAIDKCQNDGSVQGDDHIGGIAAYCKTQITNCTNTDKVVGRNSVSGIGSGSTFSNCQNEGHIIGTDSVGGITSSTAGTIQRCINRGTVEGNETVGGIAGLAYTVTECENYGNVHGKHLVGGITGQNYKEVKKCQNHASVFGVSSVGGITGKASQQYLFVQSCINTGSVSGTYQVGGIVGNQQGTVTACMNFGSVSGEYLIGGIAGTTTKSLNQCYNAGTVQGNFKIGAIAGSLLDGGALDHDYYLYGCAFDGVARQKAVGAEVNGSTMQDTDYINVAGLTEDQFKAPAFLAGFDFTEVWMYEEGQNNGLPVLRDFHTHVFDQKIAEAQHLKAGASCQSRATYYYSCACGQNGTDTFTDGEIGTHLLSDIQKDATCHYKQCSLCKGIFEHSAHVYTDACDHTCDICEYATAEKHVYAYAVNEDGHILACTVCGTVKKERVAHTYDTGKITLAPTVEHAGETTFICTECGYETVQAIEKLPAPPVTDEADDKAPPAATATQDTDYLPMYVTVAVTVVCTLSILAAVILTAKKKRNKA